MYVCRQRKTYAHVGKYCFAQNRQAEAAVFRVDEKKAKTTKLRICVDLEFSVTVNPPKNNKNYICQ